MIIYATVQYLRSSWIINYHDSLLGAEDAADIGEAALACHPVETWRIDLRSDVVTAQDLCALMLWGGDHPSTLLSGRIIRSVVRLKPDEQTVEEET